MIKFDADAQMHKVYTLDTVNYRSTTGEKLPVRAPELAERVKKYAELKNIDYGQALIEASRVEPELYKQYAIDFKTP